MCIVAVVLYPEVPLLSQLYKTPQLHNQHIRKFFFPFVSIPTSTTQLQFLQFTLLFLFCLESFCSEDTQVFFDDTSAAAEDLES